MYGVGFHSTGVKLAVKDVIDRLQLGDLLFIAAFIQLGTFLLIRKNFASDRRIAFIIITNLIVNSWLVLPFTDLGMKSKRQIHHEMIQSPRGIVMQPLQPLSQTRFPDSTFENEFLLLGSYTKRVGFPNEEKYPVELRTTANYFSDSTVKAFVSNQAYVFLSSDTTLDAETSFDSSLIRVSEFGPGYLHATVENNKYRFITLLQNDYQYWQTFLNGKPVNHATSFKTFMSVPIEKGRQDVVFIFRPGPIRKAILINIAIIFIGLLSLFIPQLKSRPLVI